jgi:hypothetical protein
MGKNKRTAAVLIVMVQRTTRNRILLTRSDVSCRPSLDDLFYSHVVYFYFIQHTQQNNINKQHQTKNLNFYLLLLLLLKLFFFIF